MSTSDGRALAAERRLAHLGLFAVPNIPGAVSVADAVRPFMPADEWELLTAGPPSNGATRKAIRAAVRAAVAAFVRLLLVRPSAPEPVRPPERRRDARPPLARLTATLAAAARAPGARPDLGALAV